MSETLFPGITVIFERRSGIESEFRLSDSEVIRVEGVRFSVALLRQILNQPPDGFYSFKRDRENIVVTKQQMEAPNRQMSDPQFLRWLADQFENTAVRERLRDIALKIESAEDAAREAEA